MARNLDITLLRAFVTVAEHGSMTAAGNALHLTQGAVSQQIARLEALAGPLFVRDRHDLRPTAAGERLLGSTRRFLDMHDALRTEMTAGAIDGAIRLGAPQDLVGTCLAPILKGFTQNNPQVELTLVCEASPELLKTLKRGTIDIALTEEPPGKSRGECVAVDRLVWVGARGGTAHGKRPLPLSMVAETCAFRPVVLDALRRHDMPWRAMFENGSIDATVAMVRADLAVTARLASTVPGELGILPAECGLPALPDFSINLHVQKGPGAPAAVELVRHLREGLARYRGST
ncbi:LysR substrate-binding domain-containing protein [Burkholderia gladioli]|uniref:LysR substrate-binding domain-containing protein n=1 Tax=Burkholderia gladioli TaxID=28095 RepID=UPI001641B1DC|nr:LysR substrate-binding domain-containing protein [Burkholderia gladioli]